MKEWELCGYRVDLYDDAIYVRVTGNVTAYYLRAHHWIRGVRPLTHAEYVEDCDYPDPTGEEQGYFHRRRRKNRR